MYRSVTCGELRIADVNKEVTLAGWVQRIRKMGGMSFIDLRDRYGITQLAFDEGVNKEVFDEANKMGREFVLQAKGVVKERYSKNAQLPTGDIEIEVKELKVLNPAVTPPFTIEDDTDGGDDIRMKYRYLICVVRLFVRIWNFAIKWHLRFDVTWMNKVFWRWRPRYWLILRQRVHATLWCPAV